MYALGIDIGTTTICAVVAECESARVVYTKTAPNASYISSQGFENLQDPKIILETVIKVAGDLCDVYKPVKAIGLSCQMHGILYVDKYGDAISPLYTWQDGRGDLFTSEGLSYAETLRNLTGYKNIASGYGAVTNYYNTVNRIAPENAAGFCTIGDYIGMRLTGDNVCRTHSSNAASIGLYGFGASRFDSAAILKAGMDPNVFPTVETGCSILGKTGGGVRGGAYDAGAGSGDIGIDAGVAVSYCIGDNQASYIGSVAKPDETVLINIGTGGQISISGVEMKNAPQLEVRPLLGDRYLLVGATLCAGRAYAALEKFFASVLRMAGAASPAPLYEAMGTALKSMNVGGDEPLIVSVKFDGTRDEPDARGSISNIGLRNFTPAHLTAGVLEGIAEELYDLYRQMDGEKSRRLLVGAGNGLRKNVYLQETISRRFGASLLIPTNTEEAAFGCVLFALTASGFYGGLEDAQSRITYHNGEKNTVIR